MGPNLIAIFLVFVLIYWVGMAENNTFSNTCTQEVRIRYRGKSTRCKQFAYNQKAPFDELHRYSYSNNHASDTLRNIYRKLFEFPRTRRYGSHAVARISCHGGRKGYEHLSLSAVFTGVTYKRYHTCL